MPSIFEDYIKDFFSLDEDTVFKIKQGIAVIDEIVDLNDDLRFAITVTPAKHKNHRFESYSALRRIATAIRVEAWLAIELLSTLDIRKAVAQLQGRDKKSFDKDQRSKSERREDAQFLVEHVIGEERLETALSQGRQEVGQWYNAVTTKEMNVYMRNEKARISRDYRPESTDEELAEGELFKLQALILAETKLAERSEFLRAYQEYRGRKKNPEIKIPDEIKYPRSKIYFRNRDTLEMIAYFSGVHPTYLWANTIRYAPYFHVMMISGKQARAEKLTKKDARVIERYVMPILACQQIPQDEVELCIYTHIHQQLRISQKMRERTGMGSFRNFLSTSAT